MTAGDQEVAQIYDTRIRREDFVNVWGSFGVSVAYNQQQVLRQRAREMYRSSRYMLVATLAIRSEAGEIERACTDRG